MCDYENYIIDDEKKYTHTHIHTSKKGQSLICEGTDGMANKSEEFSSVTENSGQRSKIVDNHFPPVTYLIPALSIILCFTMTNDQGEENTNWALKCSILLSGTAAVGSCRVEDGRRLIQMTWDSLRRLNSQLAFQWPTSTNWANLQWRPDRRYEVCRRHPFECFSIKQSPDGEDCGAAPLTSRWWKRL